ncbi:hypothetical protein AQUCO_07800008v1 [Aquilegia coerulea]|uniref:F-box domain-containing protein n=1 Tax=Aquilegia coerulea TaxID=218851 RepID=A0A2G5C7V4_AQUCA|nr:hypothetical protein AQUCO_07800008v1 [Aquilegia coerulea]
MAMETVNLRRLRLCSGRRNLNQSGNLHVLPKEIMFDIFSRLPVQTLSKFRFVCKHWYNLINDPLFINFHHSSASGFLVIGCTTKFKEDYDRQIYLLVDNQEEDQNAIPHCFSTINSSNLKPLNIQFDEFKSRKIRLVASSNGFICVGVIYTVGSAGGGIWKRIDTHNIIISNPVLIRMPPSQEFLNRALHWELEDFRKPQSKHSIGVVHIGDENFTTLETPPLDRGLNYRDLMTLHQCLCLTDEFNDRLVIWVMKSYGVAASWVREHVIDKEILGRLRTAPYITVKTLKNGSALFRGGEYHGYYHFEKREFEQILIHPPPINLDIVVHIGSLISPTSIAGTYEEYQVPPPTIRKPIRFTLKRKAEKPLTALYIFQN